MTLWLDEHYPLRAVTVTTREPEFVTPEIKHLLRRKNRLMRSNRVEEASAVAERIGKAIVKANRKELNDLDPRHGTQNLWHRVNKLIHKPRGQDQTSQVSAEDLNTHYAAISTDPAYVAPPLRHTAQTDTPILAEMSVFNMLDHLRPTAEGNDRMPAWFLRLLAPVILHALTHLINRSLLLSHVPTQWKTALIHPIPKVTTPTAPRRFKQYSNRRRRV